MNGFLHDKSRLAFRRSLTSSQVDQLVGLFQVEWWTKGRTKTDVEKILRSGGPILAFVDPQKRRTRCVRPRLNGRVYKAMIFDVIVKDNWRNTGLGDLLMETVMNDPAIVNIKHRELYCLEEMVPFYEKWGFTVAPASLRFMRKSAEF